MNKPFDAVLFLAVALAATGVQAQIFMCKDSSGKTYTSDRPISECADRPVKEFAHDGTHGREIPAPPTAEEKRQQRLKEEKRKAEAAAAEEQARNDRVILALYSSEKDIEGARKRALEQIQDQVRREQTLLAVAQRHLSELRAQADSYPKKPAGAPPDLARKIEAAAAAVNDDNKSIQDYNAEAAATNVKYDETLKRFREISTPPGETKKPGSAG